MNRPCQANKTNGDECKAQAMKGQRVCRVHGGSSPQAKSKAMERLLEAADPVAAEMVRIAKDGKAERDRISAGRDVLDRVGVGEEKAAELTVVIEWPE